MLDERDGAGLSRISRAWSERIWTGFHAAGLMQMISAVLGPAFGDQIEAEANVAREFGSSGSWNHQQNLHGLA